MAWSLSAVLAPARVRTIAARASIIVSLISGTVSRSIALVSAGSALASRDLKTACAASMRRAGSATISVSDPIAALMMPRRRLLIRTLSVSAGGSPVTGWPVAASNSLSALSRMKTFLV